MNPALCWSNSLEPLTPEEFRAWQAETRELEQRQIVFIVGPQRTGTTWLTLALDKHPNIVARHEGHAVSELVVQVFEQVERFNALSRAERPYLRIGDRDCLRLARRVVDCQLLNYLRSAPGKNARVVVDKSPNHCRHVGFLAALYPWAKFILCTRDVRDAAISMWHLRRQRGEFQHDSLEEFCLWYAREVYGDGVRAARWSARKLAPDRFMEIKYEDHLARPEEEIARTLAFIGVSASDETVRAIVTGSSFEKVAGRAPGVEGKGVFRRGVAGDWENYFSPEVGDRLLVAAAAGSGENGHGEPLAAASHGATING